MIRESGVPTGGFLEGLWSPAHLEADAAGGRCGGRHPCPHG